MFFECCLKAKNDKKCNDLGQLPQFCSFCYKFIVTFFLIAIGSIFLFSLTLGWKLSGGLIINPIVIFSDGDLTFHCSNLSTILPILAWNRAFWISRLWLHLYHFYVDIKKWKFYYWICSRLPKLKPRLLVHNFNLLQNSERIKNPTSSLKKCYKFIIMLFCKIFFLKIRSLYLFLSVYEVTKVCEELNTR